MSGGDPMADFLAAMEAAGLKPAEPIAGKLRGGKLVRFRADCDGKGRQNAWAVFHDDDRPAGAFGSWKLGISERWRSGSVSVLSLAERRERAKRYREEQAARAAALDATREATAAACLTRWEAAGAVDPRHGYLVSKGIDGEGLRQTGRFLLVPMRDERGKLWNLQTIAPNGRKLFAEGGRQLGLFFMVGEPGETIVIAEGYGTAANIRCATGFPVVAAFSSANLKATAEAIRGMFPRADLVLAADDDAHLVDHPQIKRNLGIEAAREAALAVGARLAIPPRKEAA